MLWKLFNSMMDRSKDRDGLDKEIFFRFTKVTVSKRLIDLHTLHQAKSNAMFCRDSGHNASFNSTKATPISSKTATASPSKSLSPSHVRTPPNYSSLCCIYSEGSETRARTVGSSDLRHV